MLLSALFWQVKAVEPHLEYLIEATPHVSWSHLRVVQSDSHRCKCDCHPQKDAAGDEHGKIHSCSHQDHADVKKHAGQQHGGFATKLPALRYAV